MLQNDSESCTEKIRNRRKNRNNFHFPRSLVLIPIAVVAAAATATAAVAATSAATAATVADVVALTSNSKTKF